MGDVVDIRAGKRRRAPVEARDQWQELDAIAAHLVRRIAFEDDIGSTYRTAVEVMDLFKPALGTDDRAGTAVYRLAAAIEVALMGLGDSGKGERQ